MASFCIDFSLVFLLHTIAGWPLWIATVIGFLSSFVFNYSMQRTFSFGSVEPHGKSPLKYVVLVAFNTAVTVAIVTGFDVSGVGWEIGKPIATVGMMIGNYFAFRYWIFPRLAEEAKP